MKGDWMIGTLWLAGKGGVRSSKSRTRETILLPSSQFRDMTELIVYTQLKTRLSKAICLNSDRHFCFLHKTALETLHRKLSLKTITIALYIAACFHLYAQNAHHRSCRLGDCSSSIITVSLSEKQAGLVLGRVRLFPLPTVSYLCPIIYLEYLTPVFPSSCRRLSPCL